MKLDLTNKIYNDEDAARVHLEAQLWPDGPVCPHCRSRNVTALHGKKHRKGLYQCNSCREQFSITVGTVFERSKIGLHKWVMATHLMAASKKGMSSKQLQRMLGLTYKSAWFMSMRIREAMRDDTAGPIGGEGKTVESDETYVGGKAKNAKKGKPIPKKKPVVALVERGGKLRAKHVPNVDSKNIREMLKRVDRKTHLMTDDSLIYYYVGPSFAKHDAVNHSAKEYVRGEAHVNNAESFFALVKRGMYGTYHAVSEKHLQRYVTEAEFKWNNRSALGIEDAERAANAIKGAAGKRLTYRRPDETHDA